MTDCACLDLTAEQCQALADTQDMMCQNGTLTEIILRKEPDVERDNLGAIKRRGHTPEKRFKLRASIERHVNSNRLEKFGLRETCDTTATYAVADWIDAGVIQLDRLGESFKAVDTIRSTALLDGSEWKIKDKGLSGRIGGVPLFITLGLQEN
jgi:hypothetical protein